MLNWTSERGRHPARWRILKRRKNQFVDYLNWMRCCCDVALNIRGRQTTVWVALPVLGAEAAGAGKEKADFSILEAVCLLLFFKQ